VSADLKILFQELLQLLHDRLPPFLADRMALSIYLWAQISKYSSRNFSSFFMVFASFASVFFFLAIL